MTVVATICVLRSKNLQTIFIEKLNSNCRRSQRANPEDWTHYRRSHRLCLPPTYGRRRGASIL